MSIRELIDPSNSALIFIDHQPQMSFGVANIDRQLLKNNTVALAKAGKIFDVPVIYTSVETKSFSGYIWPELLAVHPQVKPIERTSMNSWEDAAFVEAVKATGRKKLIISALWTEVCLTFPALMALEEGFEVYVVTDTSGGTSVDAHERSIDRMVQAGAVAFSDDGHFDPTAKVLLNAYDYLHAFDKVIINHEEETSLVEDGVMNEGHRSAMLGMKGRPTVAEDIAVARDVMLAEYAGARVHVAHMSSARAVDIVRQAKKRGVRVTAEVTPQHLTMTDDCVNLYDSSTKINPPLRTQADCDAYYRLWKRAVSRAADWIEH